MRILICGGRNFNDKSLMRREIIEFLKESGVFSHEALKSVTIIHGGAKGADSIAGLVADELGIETVVYPADWEKYSKSAGIIRNKEMADKGKPDFVLAFPGGAGTHHMVSYAKSKGIHVILMGQGK